MVKSNGIKRAAERVSLNNATLNPHDKVHGPIKHDETGAEVVNALNEIAAAIGQTTSPANGMNPIMKHGSKGRFDIEANQSSVRAETAETVCMSIEINDVAKKLPPNNKASLSPMKFSGNGSLDLSVPNCGDDLERANS